MAGLDPEVLVPARDSLENKVLLMSGAGPGVGRAVALLAAERGALIALLARTPATLDETASAVERRGGRALCLPADVADPQSVRSAVDRTVQHYGHLDILVHSILPPHLLKPVLALADDELPAWRNSVSTSVFGAMAMGRAAGKIMVAQGGGAIVYVTATSALQGYPTVSAHAAGKAGIHALAQCLASEIGPQGVRVNCVAPGVIDGATVRGSFPDPEERARFVAAQVELNATRRMPTDDDIAETVLFLASDAAAGISGQILAVDGGRYFH
jgi:NAD(P)-dependent dehydrogenase (short-subunit alcohol dehydrogenase family)